MQHRIETMHRLMVPVYGYVSVVSV